MLKSLRGVLFLFILSGLSSVSMAADLTGAWVLNFPAGAEAVWDFEQTEDTFTGYTEVQAGRFLTTCMMEGEVLAPRFSDGVFIADIISIRTPGNLVTNAIAVFQVDGDEIRGVVVEFLQGIPVSYTELDGYRLLE